MPNGTYFTVCDDNVVKVDTPRAAVLPPPPPVDQPVSRRFSAGSDQTANGQQRNMSPMSDREQVMSVLDLYQEAQYIVIDKSSIGSMSRSTRNPNVILFSAKRAIRGEKEYEGYLFRAFTENGRVYCITQLLSDKCPEQDYVSLDRAAAVRRGAEIGANYLKGKRADDAENERLRQGSLKRLPGFALNATDEACFQERQETASRRVEGPCVDTAETRSGQAYCVKRGYKEETYNQIVWKNTCKRTIVFEDSCEGSTYHNVIRPGMDYTPPRGLFCGRYYTKTSRK